MSQALEKRDIKATFQRFAFNFMGRMRQALTSLTGTRQPPFTGIGGQSFHHPGYSEYDPYSFGRYAGTGIDYQQAVGPLTSHSLVMSIVNWLGTQMTEAPLKVYRDDQQKQQQEQARHPLVKLLRNPNPFYTGGTLFKAFALSWIVDGNVYWYKVRDQAERVTSLWYLPHHSVTPLYPEDGYEYITGYAYRVNGQDFLLRREDVVHFRYNLDPDNIRKGLSPLGSLLRELYVDNERANYSAALLRNFGIPGCIISPGSDAHVLNEETREELKQAFRRQFTGDHRGEPMVASAGIRVDVLGFEPQKMDLSKQSDLPEERVSAVTNIPAAVVGFGSGMDNTNYATMKELREQAYEGVVIPTQKLIAQEIDAQLLREFDGAETDNYTEFDLSDVRVLQEDATKKTERMLKLWVGGGITRAELRASVGFPVDAKRDAVFVASAGTALVPEDKADGQTLMPTVSIFDQQQAAAGGGQGAGQTWPPKQGATAAPARAGGKT